jgi:hypothetical protein
MRRYSVKAAYASFVFPPWNGIIGHMLTPPIFECAFAVNEYDHVLADAAEVKRAARHFRDQAGGEVEELKVAPSG